MTIREAQPDDAEQIIAHVQRLANEPDTTIPLAPGEFQVTVEQERRLLSGYLEADNSIFLVAEIDGQIIGVLNCDGGKRQANRHAASTGMSVAKEWRNKGVGTALKLYLIEWAKGTGIIKRLEAEIYAHNAPNIHLHQKLGFVEEGRRRNAYFQHGRFIDSIIMTRLL
jgi:RimJ/RimL family protein N-acetyltransferase